MLVAGEDANNFGLQTNRINAGLEMKAPTSRPRM
jgi:hypothetical protein